jgi:hypothetical protein
MAEKKSILLRLSPGMWEEISKWAEDEFRSVNGQIEYLISEALHKRNKSDHSKKEANGGSAEMKAEEAKGEDT